MNTDLSFITNEENQSLKNRFEVLIKDTSFFDCLVGYFGIVNLTSCRHNGTDFLTSLRHTLIPSKLGTTVCATAGS